MMSILLSLFVLSLVHVSNGAVINSASQDVSIKMVVPRGLTQDEYLQSIVDYWTSEQMATAQPMDLVMVNENDLSYFAGFRKNDGIEKILTPSSLLPGIRATVPSTAGKVYFVMNGKNYLCSASVVNANNRDTVVTAAHCIFDFDSKKWATSWIFVPQYSIGSRPIGTFTWRQMVTKQGWTNNRDFNFDVAIVLMNRNERGQHIQDATGGLGITINPSRQATTNAFGYPKNMNSGETMSTCAGTSSSPTYVSGFSGLQLTCGMTGGASGGPWIQQYNTVTLSGQQVSVNSFIITNRPNNMYGPYFNDDNIGSLYRDYQDL